MATSETLSNKHTVHTVDVSK